MAGWLVKPREDSPLGTTPTFYIRGDVKGRTIIAGDENEVTKKSISFDENDCH